MKKSLFSLLSLVIIINLFVFAFTPALALADVGDDIRDQLDPIEDVYGQSGVDEDTFGETVAGLIKVVLSILGIIFVILVIYGGFTWMLSAGNDEKISRAKKIIIAAVIGVTIVFFAYIVTVFVMEGLITATGAN